MGPQVQQRKYAGRSLGLFFFETGSEFGDGKLVMLAQEALTKVATRRSAMWAHG